MMVEFGEWTKVEDELPEERESYFARYKGTDKWMDGMFEKTSSTVIVTAHHHGKPYVTTSSLNDGKWRLPVRIPNLEVIAWMPMPKPYEEVENEQLHHA